MSRRATTSRWLLALLLFTASSPGWSQCFNAATNFSITDKPAVAVTGDFNGDGKADLVTVNTEASTISLLLNDGTGGFGPTTDFTVGNSPRSAAAGDFNGDGKLDLATANASNTVSILLGNGSGNFGTTSVAVPGIPVSVAVGDFNSDGALDLITATYSYGSVTLLPGNGAGGFGSQSSFNLGHQPVSVTVGDFNGDGKPDLVTANQNTTALSVLLNNGSGGFGAVATVNTGGVAASVAVGDFNGDGKLDLATPSYNAKSVSLLLGTGTGSFGNPTNFSLNHYPSSLAPGDFDADGKLDLAVADAGNTVSVLLGTGNGSFGAETVFGVAPGVISVVAGDLNGDGKADLATSNYTSKSVSILLNCPSQANPVTISVNPAALSGFTTDHNTPSAAKQFQLVAAGFPPSVTFGVEPPLGYELSFDGMSYGTNLSVAVDNSGARTTTLYVRLRAMQALGLHEGNITFDSKLPNQPVLTMVALSGMVTNNQPLQLLQPLYNCQTGGLTFQSIGGDGSPVEYRAIGVTDWTTNPNQVLDAPVRQDVNSQPIPIQARQGQTMVSYSFDFRGYCNNGNPVSNQAPVFHGPLASVTGSLGSGFNYSLPPNIFTDPDAGDVLTYTATNLPPGLVLATGDIVGLPKTAGTYVVILTATDPGGLMATGTMTIVITNDGQPPVSALTLLQPLYNCQTGAITFQTSGGDGTPVSFFCVGVVGGSTQTSYVLEAAIRNDVNSQPLTIQATQSGVTVSYVFDWRGYCGQARIGAAEVVDAWTLRSLGNPVTSEAVIELADATGQPVTVSLVSLTGRVVERRLVTPTTAQHQEVFDVTGQGAGMLLLRAESASRNQTLKLLKQ